MQTIFLIALFISGACIGSFLCCQARRLHLRQGKPKLSSHLKSFSSHHKPTANPVKLGKRSICLHCGKQLKWYDNIPIISWLILGGRCRKCHHKIGLAELLSELSLAFALLALGTTVDIAALAPLDLGIFIATVFLVFSLFFLAIYDGLYGQLPTLCLIISIIFALVLLGLKEWASISTSGFDVARNLIDPIASVLILGGLYFFLYQISKGKWVGDGDWLLGTAIGLGLCQPWLALIALFLANLLAYFVMLPAVKKKKNHKIHFGPFLVAAFVIVTAFSNFFLSILP